jgi:hypothetical protein
MTRPTCFDYVRRYYGVPAGRGVRVTDYQGRTGTITRATHYVFVRLDGTRHAIPFHPTWRLTYHTDAGDVVYGENGRREA